MSADFEMDLTGLTGEDLEQDGRVPPGRYHVEIIDAVRDTKSQTPCLHLKCKILAGTDATAVGAVQNERLYMSEKAQKRAGIFARRLGLIDDTACGTKFILNWQAAVGLQAIVEIVSEEYEKKDGGTGTSSKISFAGLWSLDDDRGKDVPRDKAAIARAGQPKPKAAAKASAADDFSDL
jgi:hypothetical protein